MSTVFFLFISNETPYTGVVNPQAAIGKPCNGQRNVGNCMRGRKTENEKISSRPYF